MPAREDTVLHFAEYRHVFAHGDVIGGHVDDVVERAAAFSQYGAQVLPTSDELRLRVEDDFHIPCASHLPGTIERVTYSDGGCIACTVHD